MSYRSDIYASVMEKFSEKNGNAQAEADARRKELDSRFPEIKQIDDALSSTAMRIIRIAAQGKEGLKEKIEELRCENEVFLAARAEFLVSHGYPADYSDPRYECDICKDMGFVGGKMCACLKRAMAEEGIRRSGISKMMERQNFDTFSLSYYEGKDRENMENILFTCRKFADDFSDGKMTNLLMMGATGLGKTHLSSAIAKSVIEKGYYVIYESAPNIHAEFERSRFVRDNEENRTQCYFDCELLIIDDLGVEPGNEYSLSCIYNLINTRLVSEKSTVVSTNLVGKELRERYKDRLTSRLLGEYTTCLFTGKDVRPRRV